MADEEERRVRREVNQHAAHVSPVPFEVALVEVRLGAAADDAAAEEVSDERDDSCVNVCTSKPARVKREGAHANDTRPHSMTTTRFT